jgi:hypothetical protein
MISSPPQTPGVYLGLFAHDTYVYATDRKEGYVLRKLLRGLSAIETRCEPWNIKLNKDKTQAIYFSHRLRPLEAHLTLNDIPCSGTEGFVASSRKLLAWLI